VENAAGQGFLKVEDGGIVYIGKIGDGEVQINSGNFRTYFKFNSNKLEFRDYQTQAGALSSTGLILTNGSDPSATNRLDVVGKAFIGSTVIPASASLHIRGAASTSASSSLRIENSNGSASLVVRDDGNVNMYNNLTVTGSISTSTNTTGQSTLGTGLVVNNTAGSSTINDFQVKSQLYNAIYVSSSANSIGIMSNASGKLGFFGATPTTQSAGWSVANYLVSKSFDANAITLEQLADVVGTILTELKNKGLLG